MWALIRQVLGSIFLFFQKRPPPGNVPQNKKIGFRLSGSIRTPIPHSERKTELCQFEEDFEVILFPRTKPISSVQSTKNENSKTVGFEWPEEMKVMDFSQLYQIFIRDPKPFITLSGFEKTGDRRLNLLFTSSRNHNSLDIEIIIQGELDRTKQFRIHLTPSHRSSMIGWIREVDTKNSTQVRCEIAGEKGDDPDLLQQIAKHLKPNNFEVSLNSQVLWILLADPLKQLLSEKRKSKPHTQQVLEKPNNEQPHSVQSKDPLFQLHQEAAADFQQVVLLYESSTQSKLTNIQLVDKLYLTDCLRRLNQKTLASKKEDFETLEVVNRLLFKHHMRQFKHEIKYAVDQAPLETCSFIEVFEPTYCRYLLSTLAYSINFQIKVPNPILAYQLEVLSGLLVLLYEQNIHDSSRYEEFYQYLYPDIVALIEDKQQASTHFSTRFFALRCLYSFSDKGSGSSSIALSGAPTLLRRAYAKIIDTKSLENPLKIAFSTIEEYLKSENDFRGCLKKEFWKQNENRWFLDLLGIQRLLFDPSPLPFCRLVESLEVTLNQPQDKRFQDPYLIFGLAELISKLIHSRELLEPSSLIREEAIQLLKMLFSCNQANGPHSLFRVSDEPLRDELSKRLRHFLGNYSGNRLCTRVSVGLRKM